ncbi:AraC family transcriptional regulator [Candidatus Dependentiae bacterium]|nr:AraC family transcriptional regulator [Candidatus Dependentiae bacterium]
MLFKIATKNEIKVMGVELKTTNQNNQAAIQIPQFWQKFYTQNIKDQIPNKIEDEILGLYIDYEGDFTKPYSFVICCKVSCLENIPNGMVGKIIPASKYAVFSTKGKYPESLLKTWQNIWTSNLDRTYTGDFEIYKQNLSATQNPEIDVYIAIK